MLALTTLAACLSNYDDLLKLAKEKSFQDNETSFSPTVETVSEPCSSQTYYEDKDGDGFGMSGNPTVSQCEQPEGYSTFGNDCDDTNATLFPEALPIDGDGCVNDCSAITEYSSLISGNTISAPVYADSYDYTALSMTSGDYNFDGQEEIVIGQPGAQSLLVLDNQTAEIQTSLFSSGVGERAFTLLSTVKGGTDSADAICIGDLGTETRNHGFLCSSGALLYDTEIGMEGVAAISWIDQGTETESGFTIHPWQNENLILGRPNEDMVYPLIWNKDETTLIDLDTDDLDVITGPADSRFGAALETLTDFDGDGICDLVVGAPDESDQTGALYLFKDTSTFDSSLSYENADARIEGQFAGVKFGTALAGYDDQNSDGHADLGVIATGPVCETNLYGAVSIFASPLESSDALASAQTLICPTNEGTQIQSSLLGHTDLNNDGQDDVIVRATNADSSGEVLVWYETPSESLTTDSANWRIQSSYTGLNLFGWQLLGQDRGNDQTDDLVISDPLFFDADDNNLGGIFYLNGQSI